MFTTRGQHSIESVDKLAALLALQDLERLLSHWRMGWGCLEQASGESYKADRQKCIFLIPMIKVKHAQRSPHFLGFHGGYLQKIRLIYLDIYLPYNNEREQEPVTQLKWEQVPKTKIKLGI